jgi:ketosteroid isomerase-like protein
VTFTLAPPLRHTAPEIHDADQLRSWFAGFDGPIGYEIRDLTVTAGEDVAFCHSLNRLSATPVGAPAGFDLWFRSTVGLRKSDGSWRITHEHQSTPFYMEQPFQAAIDLQP